MSQTLGFWGSPTASIDWCEPNYAVTPYFAEFWNTVSSLFLALVGCFAIIQSQKFEKRFIFLGFLLFVVGIGSALFHGTLLFHFQLADELPMLWSSTMWLYILLELSSGAGTGKKTKNHNHNHSSNHWGKFLPVLLGGATVAWAVFAGKIHFEAPNVFRVVFGGVLASCVFLLVFSARRLFSRTRRPFDPFVKAALAVYFGSVSVGFSLWMLDHIYCSELNSLSEKYLLFRLFGSLHGWWHVLMGINCYAGGVATYVLRYCHIKQTHSLRLSLGVLPFLVPNKNKSM